jgi:hypothetical protein
MINSKKSGHDVGLATGDPDIRTLDLGAQFLSLSLSPSPSLLYSIFIWAASFILFHIVRWNMTDS